MAKHNPKSKTGGRDRLGADKVPAQVRTGGFIGSDSMQKLKDFAEGGAGVDESKVKHVGEHEDPNEDLHLVPKIPGAED